MVSKSKLLALLQESTLINAEDVLVDIGLLIYGVSLVLLLSPGVRWNP
tara:strand:+ start:815 stop:958 length:144 start_codon:yes stop_codon:yes gene_type:complete